MSEPTTAAMIARAVYYSGRVQGVGFRATTAHLARSYAVSGWVRNLPDRRVELFVEGVEAEVLRFLEAVRNRWRGYIQDEVIETKQPTGQTRRFEIVG
jgi:acylphosphatase